MSVNKIGLAFDDFGRFLLAVRRVSVVVALLIDVHQKNFLVRAGFTLVLELDLVLRFEVTF